MSFRVIYDSEAAFEFREAIVWYESQRDGLGVRFIVDIDKVIAAISAQPFRFSKAGNKSRKAQILGWPYTIYFAVNEGHSEVKVIAIWHGARNPAELRRRLK
jgi:plasmid stabilization system protein ParE